MFKAASTPLLSTIYLLDWLDGVALTKEHHSHAKNILKQLAARSPEVAALLHTPQTAPHHSEGGQVESHVVRMLATLSAIESGQSLAGVEEIVRDRHYHLEFAELEAILRCHIPFLAAYAVLHDIAKPAALSFSAVPGSRGQHEGFDRKRQIAPAGERDRFSKLTRAFAAAHPEHNEAKLQAAFFAEYGIRAHYFGHDRLGASSAYSQTRQLVFDFFQIPSTQARLMSELVRVHMDVLTSFSDRVDVARYRTLVALPDRLGLNRALFLELIPACLFLDGVAGSLSLTKQGAVVADLTPVRNLYAAEREAAPERHAERLLTAERGRKQAIREALAEAGLEANTVFALLNTPYGPVRGQVMEQIYDLVRGTTAVNTFGAHGAELARRATMAQELLKARGLHL